MSYAASTGSPDTTGTSKSAAAIDRAKAQGRAALIGYLPAGYPSVAETIAAGIALAENGADLIEVGIPYSDPVMDGQVIQAAGGEAVAVTLDVTDPASAKRAVREAYEQFGSRFDGLINNAGTDRGAGILELTDEQWQQVIAVNQSGPLYLTREFLRRLGPGERPFPADVVNVISISAITVGTDAAAYNSSKAALAMLTLDAALPAGVAEQLGESIGASRVAGIDLLDLEH